MSSTEPGSGTSGAVGCALQTAALNANNVNKMRGFRSMRPSLRPMRVTAAAKHSGSAAVIEHTLNYGQTPLTQGRRARTACHPGASGQRMARNPRYDILFEPVKIGPVTARNRFYAVPHAAGMTNSMPRMRAAFRGTKAEGGWGVV